MAVILTQERLKKVLDYDPETGLFKRKKRKTHSKGCGGVNTYGTITIYVEGGQYFAHRLAFLYMEGYFPEDDVIHINGEKTDNRWCNLKTVAHSCAVVFHGRKYTNKSGVTGVNKHKCGKWAARIIHKDKANFLGLFTEFKDAVKARYEAEQQLNCVRASSAYQWLKENNEL